MANFDAVRAEFAGKLKEEGSPLSPRSIKLKSDTNSVQEKVTTASAEKLSDVEKPAPLPLSTQEISDKANKLKTNAESTPGKVAASFKNFLIEVKTQGAVCPAEANIVLEGLVKTNLITQTTFDKTLGPDWNKMVRISIRDEQQRMERDLRALLEGDPSVHAFHQVEGILTRFQELGIPSAIAIPESKQYFQTHLPTVFRQLLTQEVDEKGIKTLFRFYHMMERYGVDRQEFSSGLLARTKDWIRSVQPPAGEPGKGKDPDRVMEEFYNTELSYSEQIDPLVVTIGALVEARILEQGDANELILGLPAHFEAQKEILAVLPKPEDKGTGSEKFSQFAKDVSKEILVAYFASMAIYVANFVTDLQCIRLLDPTKVVKMQTFLSSAYKATGDIQVRPDSILDFLRMTPVQRGPRIIMLLRDLNKAGVSGPFFDVFLAMAERSVELSDSVRPPMQ